MINAKPGDVIEFGAGRFDFRSTLSLDVSGVTIRGQGPDKTILSFKDQGQGPAARGCSSPARRTSPSRTSPWKTPGATRSRPRGPSGSSSATSAPSGPAGPKETNGGYGFYPVICTDVVIEDCTAIGASDAGIYVGQSENIIVRRNRAEKNVAGIEIENSTRADVYENLATDNSGGILVFTMPDLPKKDGRHCRVFHNRVLANNHENFAPKGNTVASVPPGTGVMIMANDQVEVFDNTIEQNQTAGLSIVSYLITDKPIAGPEVRPVLRGDPHPRQPLRVQRRQAGRGDRRAAGQGPGDPAARHPLRRRRRPEEAGRRQAARRPGDPHPRQRQGRLRQLRRHRPEGVRRPRGRRQEPPRRTSSATSRRTTASSRRWRPSRSRD